MRISDWSSDVCSSDLADRERQAWILGHAVVRHARWQVEHVAGGQHPVVARGESLQQPDLGILAEVQRRVVPRVDLPAPVAERLQQEHVVLVDVRTDRAAGGGEADHHVVDAPRSEEHTSELQSLMRISYAVFCLKKKIKKNSQRTINKQ